MREDHQAKGRRYLTEARLAVQQVSPHAIRATCRGQGDIYRCGWDQGTGWWCECPAVRRCCHLVALQLVAIAPTHKGGGDQC